MDFVAAVRYCERMDTEGFGQRLRRVREGLGVGLRELHRRSGIGLSTLQQWESGKRWAGKAPPGDDIKRIEIALGVPIGSLLATTEEAKAMSVRPRTVTPIDYHSGGAQPLSVAATQRSPRPARCQTGAV